MKKAFLSLMVVMCVALPAQAELAKLGSGRISSVSDAGAAISGISLTFEQPMLGMMAVGSIQQGLMNFGGAFEQNKPVGIAVYTTEKLPPISEMSAEELLSGDGFFPEESLAFAVMIPVAASPEDFFKSRGITEPVDGAAKIDETTWASVHDGYAVFSNNEDAAKITKAEIDSVLSSKIQGAVAEVEISKLAMMRFVEFQMASERKSLAIMREMESEMEMEDNEDTEVLGKWIDVANLLADFSEAQFRRGLKTLQQVGTIGIGFSYDMVNGMSFDGTVNIDVNGEMSKLLGEVRPMDPALLAKIPASAFIAAAIGENPMAMMDSKGTIEDVLHSVVPKIKDAQLRDNISELLNAAIRTYGDSESSIFYIDHDSDGRFVAVARDSHKDMASAKELSAKEDALILDVLSKFAPNQKIASFDSTNSVLSISFSEILKEISKIEDFELDASEIAEIEGYIDPFAGKGFEIATQIEDSEIRLVAKPVGSNYSIKPSATAADDLMARIGSLTPAGITAKPASVLTLSFGPLMKKVMETASQFEKDPEDSAEMKKFIADLPNPKPHGLIGLTYAEGRVYRTRVNISVDELKWFVGFFKNLAAVTRQKTFESLEELDEFDGEEVEFKDSDEKDFDEEDSDEEAPDEADAEVIEVQIAE